ncbi:hypothetical protein [Streptomyces sp. NBC_01643]|nr:hypothetical protein OHB03_03655 [Streptomyces sp. NBC_01643]
MPGIEGPAPRRSEKIHRAHSIRGIDLPGVGSCAGPEAVATVASAAVNM